MGVQKQCFLLRLQVVLGEAFLYLGSSNSNNFGNNSNNTSATLSLLLMSPFPCNTTQNRAVAVDVTRARRFIDKTPVFAVRLLPKKRTCLNVAKRRRGEREDCKGIDYACEEGRERRNAIMYYTCTFSKDDATCLGSWDNFVDQIQLLARSR